MRHRNADPLGELPHPNDEHTDRRHHHHPSKRHRRGHGRHGGRLFDYGELRLLVLALIAEQPRHGYELMRVLEERTGGGYSPSPGVIYPTLAWLEDGGYAQVVVERGSRKSYRITSEGEALHAANRAAVEELFQRIGAGGGRHAGMPAPVVRAMENLKLALRLRLKGGPVDQAAAETIAAALDTAAQTVERS